MKLKNVKHVKSGIIEIRNLIALYVVLIMLPLALCIFIFCANFDFDYKTINDEIALYKLRKIYLLSYNQEIAKDHLSFQYDDRYFTLELINNHLVLKPGTQIFLEDVDDLYFENDDSCIQVVYTRKGKRYEKVISQKEGLYIDDFSCVDDVVLEPDDGDGLSLE